MTITWFMQSQMSTGGIVHQSLLAILLFVLMDMITQISTIYKLNRLDLDERHLQPQD